ncbi:hypothetical protein CHS0354_022613 [Potamilus streckersoni]|uniref:Uncharacterized protein n=1 Tax=Potamilus streckersoni TaxID=2493646 RepID=A0AAE0VKJ4_9BIVA|nr:hypothetical protein CHS0354_022613 [Potamilus streckersoni]
MPFKLEELKGITTLNMFCFSKSGDITYTCFCLSPGYRYTLGTLSKQLSRCYEIGEAKFRNTFGFTARGLGELRVGRTISNNLPLLFHESRGTRIQRHLAADTTIT